MASESERDHLIDAGEAISRAVGQARLDSSAGDWALIAIAMKLAGVQVVLEDDSGPLIPRYGARYFPYRAVPESG